MDERWQEEGTKFDDWPAVCVAVFIFFVLMLLVWAVATDRLHDEIDGQSTKVSIQQTTE